MSQSKIGPGPGNLVPHSETKFFLAGGTVTVGAVVALSGAASGEARGYTAVAAASGAAATSYAVGVAKEAAASGEWFEAYVSGYCPLVQSDNSVAAGDYIVVHTVAGEVDTMADGEEEQVIGMALEDDTTTGCACLLFKRI